MSVNRLFHDQITDILLLRGGGVRGGGRIRKVKGVWNQSGRILGNMHTVMIFMADNAIQRLNNRSQEPEHKITDKA